ncbi:hypothetical protein P4V41_07710 [Fictibacillus nanhaiensis]|uniref:hypothetical protein n=1 Tax=Fictibacillus nanhaiensis TaxID=742169 RepID=UPI002E1D63BD|nr:hypothetical protein [Fictibacillus nanhaiensis]
MKIKVEKVEFKQANMDGVNVQECADIYFYVNKERLRFSGVFRMSLEEYKEEIEWIEKKIENAIFIREK